MDSDEGRNDCGNAVLSDAVMSAGFDYEK